jgi:hypothetical protein
MSFTAFYFLFGTVAMQNHLPGHRGKPYRRLPRPKLQKEETTTAPSEKWRHEAPFRYIDWNFVEGNNQNDMSKAGAFGLLWALGADSNLFQKRKEAREAQKEEEKKRGENEDPDWENVGKKKYTPRLFWLKGRRTVYVRQVLQRTGIQSDEGEYYQKQKRGRSGRCCGLTGLRWR